MNRKFALSLLVGAISAAAVPVLASAWTLDAVKTEPEFDLSRKSGYRSNTNR